MRSNCDSFCISFLIIIIIIIILTGYSCLPIVETRSCVSSVDKLAIAKRHNISPNICIQYPREKDVFNYQFFHDFVLYALEFDPACAVQRKMNCFLAPAVRWTLIKNLILQHPFCCFVLPYTYTTLFHYYYCYC
jgi:hypothetical protein